MKNLKRVARVFGLPLGEVTSWRNKPGVRFDQETKRIVNTELGKLSTEELERYCLCVAAVSGVDFETYGEPVLHKHCRDIRKKLCEHDVVEIAIDCIARNRK